MMSPFSLLLQIAQPSEQSEIWSDGQSIEGWLAFERALALAQADAGVTSAEDGAAIACSATSSSIDDDALWATARLVGYPILELARQIATTTPGSAAGRVHYGATTQDVMDTATALQAQRSLQALDRLAGRLGVGRLFAVVIQHPSAPGGPWIRIVRLRSRRLTPTLSTPTA